MALMQKQKSLTPGDQLRDVLAQLEAQIGKLEYSEAEDMLRILDLLDEAHERLVALEQRDANVAPARARFETALAQFERKAPRFLRILGGRPALAAAREARQPEVAQWWWRIDERLAEQKRARQRRTLRSALIAGAVLVVLAVLYALFLAPDPATRERIRYQQDAEQMAERGEYAEALAAAEQGLSYEPDHPDLLVLQGVLHDLLEQPEAASAAFERAQQMIPERENFLLTRAQMYHIAGALERAMADIETLLADDPDMAYAHFYQGLIYETGGQYFKANDAYEQAAALADEQDNAELEGMARVQLAQLMMKMMAPTPVPAKP